MYLSGKLIKGSQETAGLRVFHSQQDSTYIFNRFPEPAWLVAENRAGPYNSQLFRYRKFSSRPFGKNGIPKVKYELSEVMRV
jgi:hypothetical protein